MNSERRPDSERELWTIDLDDLSGTTEMTRRGEDSQSETVLGPFRTARGMWHGERWQQNENGETQLEPTEPSQVEKGVSQTVTRLHAPIDAWMLETTYESGHVTREYYDPKTFYLVRMERTAAGHTVHTTYDDFRTDALGRTRPWHVFGGDDRPNNAFDYRLVRDELDPDVGDLSVPHDRRVLVEFPADGDAVQLPARIENDRIYVRLDIGGRSLDFLLDTGCAGLTINDALARELGLPVYGRATQTVAGSFETGRVVVPQVAIGPLVMHDVVMRTVPLASNEAHDTRVVGLLGFDFLDAVSLKIDYTDGTVVAMRPGALNPPPAAMPLDVRLNTGAPVTRASVGDASGDDFILDTGAAFSYVVFQRFVREHPELFEPAPAALVRSGSGVGGSILFRALPAKRLSLGTLEFSDAAGVEALSADALGFDNEDGLIGSDLLKQFTLYLDYASNRIYLQSSPHLGALATPPAHRY